MSAADTGTSGSRPGGLHRRRVVLVAESAGLGAVLNHLLDPADQLSQLSSLRELAESRSLDSADVVVLDVPPRGRAAAVEQIRRRHLGPLIVLMAKGEPIRGLCPDDACALLTRPFSTKDLGAALATPGQARGPQTGGLWTPDRPTIEGQPRSPTGRPDPGPRRSSARSGPVAPLGAGPASLVGAGTAGVAPIPTVGTSVPPGTTTDPAGADPTAADPKASAQQAPVRRVPSRPPGRPGLVNQGYWLLATLTQGWQARRWVRVAGLSAFALIAFTAAFALAAQGNRCGPGCDAFGTVFSPEPTVAPASSSPVPSTTAPKRSTTTTAAPSGFAGAGAFRGVSGWGGRLAVTSTTTTTERQITETTVSATTWPATTKPPPTTAPPTTAPPTTAPPTTAPPTTAGA